jgi:hypothetical protein
VGALFRRTTSTRHDRCRFTLADGGRYQVSLINDAGCLRSAMHRTVTYRRLQPCPRGTRTRAARTRCEETLVSYSCKCLGSCSSNGVLRHRAREGCRTDTRRSPVLVHGGGLRRRRDLRARTTRPSKRRSGTWTPRTPARRELYAVVTDHSPETRATNVREFTPVLYAIDVSTGNSTRLARGTRMEGYGVGDGGLTAGNMDNPLSGQSACNQALSPDARLFAHLEYESGRRSSAKASRRDRTRVGEGRQGHRHFKRRASSWWWPS